eukprot:COSAG01_NODE_27283_length_689_cov_2.232203_1_plen_147_part_10
MLLLAATAAGAAMLLPSSLPFELYAPRATNVGVAPVAAAAGRWEAQWLRKDPRRPGYWSGNVSGMQPGDGYVFRVDGADRVDPSCVDIAQNSTHSVVPRPYTWRNPRRVVSSQARAKSLIRARGPASATTHARSSRRMATGCSAAAA